ncbi:MAG: flavocytochrome c [Syntrophales bacterium]|jgi:flavocytochrome c|nr:flavocytochrome c [Syntrophales bacterium]MDY0043677.1 flavocytochrome c [Syntrophales bacterium]
MAENTFSENKGVTRRGFLKTTGTVAIAGVASGGLLAGVPRAFSAELPQEWNEEIDVAVVGSGFAGLAAAIEAKNAGASVKVYEKMRVAGGNSIINGGVMAVVGSDMQEAKGIQDSPDLMLQDMMKAGLYLNYPELARMVAYQSKDAYNWCKEYLGVGFGSAAQLLHMGGHTVARSCPTSNYSGSAIVNKELAKLKELGVPVVTQVYLEKIFKDKDGRVAGIQIREGYRFPDEKSGTIKTVRTKKGLVMATGGFSRDVRYRMTQDPKLIDTVNSTNQPGATAEGLLEMFKIGGNPVQPSWIQLGPWASPDEKGFGLGPHFATGPVFSYGVMVDPATGKRFISELADRKIRADAIIRTGHAAIGISDSEGVKSMGGPPGALQKLLERSVVKKFDALDGLCESYNMPCDAVKKTIEDYNSYVKAGTDKEFNRFIQPDAKPMTNPPFYAIRLWPKVHHTMGGVQINDKGEVIDVEGNSIKGLYAAGEVAGGVHGAVRLGSCAVVDCLVFGRIAGKNAGAL